MSLFQFGQLSQYFLMPTGDFLGNFHIDLYEQVTGTTTSRISQPSSTKRKDLSGLGTWRNLKCFAPLERRNFNRSA